MSTTWIVYSIVLWQNNPMESGFNVFSQIDFNIFSRQGKFGNSFLGLGHCDYSISHNEERHALATCPLGRSRTIILAYGSCCFPCLFFSARGCMPRHPGLPASSCYLWYLPLLFLHRVDCFLSSQVIKILFEIEIGNQMIDFLSTKPSLFLVKHLEQGEKRG